MRMDVLIALLVAFTSLAVTAQERAVTDYSARTSTVTVGDLRDDSQLVIPQDAASVKAVSNIDSAVNALYSYLVGDNFRVVVTNYNSAVNEPRSWYEYRMATNEDWRTVWREQDGLDSAVSNATAIAHADAEALIASPTNRAWGHYTSDTGVASPDGLAQLNGVNGLLIGSGLAFTQVEGQGSFWVLTSTSPTQFETTTNGAFNVYASDGNLALSIRLGDLQDFGADPSSLHWTDDKHHIVITYPVESKEHPTLYTSPTIKPFTWSKEDESTNPLPVVWSGESKAWVATVDCTGHEEKQYYFKATFKKGCDTVIDAVKPLKISQLVIGNTYYTVAVENVSGKSVLTLTPVTKGAQ